MKLRVMANEKGIGYVYLNDQLIWRSLLEAGVTDFTLEQVEGAADQRLISCEWIETYLTAEVVPLASVRHTGRVLWFNGAKGFGFIRPSLKGPDLWAHFSEIDETVGFRTLSEGDAVTFETHTTERGLSAKKIRKV